MYMLWLSSFLENRQASVRFNRTISYSRKIHQEQIDLNFKTNSLKLLNELLRIMCKISFS